MTNEERTEALIAKLKEKFPQLEGHEKHIRQAVHAVIEGLNKQDLKTRGAYTPEMYFEAIEKNLAAFGQFTP